MHAGRALQFGMFTLLLGVLFSLSSGSAPAEPQAPKTKPNADLTFEKKIRPFLDTYCAACHNDTKMSGGITLSNFKTEADCRKDRKLWQEIEKQVLSGEMPPKNKKQPDGKSKDEFVQWIEAALTKVDCGLGKDPGRVTIRRLNRAEYNNTIRDLCGVSINPADDFPADDVGYGFDNIGDVLSVQPILIEKYMAAADKVLEAALPTMEKIPSSKQTFRPQNIVAFPRGVKTKETNEKGRQIDRIIMTVEATAQLEKFNFPVDGEYIISTKVWGTKVGDEAAKVAVRLDGKDIKTTTVEAPQNKPINLETKLKVKQGERKVSVSFVNPYTDKDETDPKKKYRTLGMETIEIEGPIGGAAREVPTSIKLILVANPSSKNDNKSAAEKVLTEFARRAFRRPASKDEITRLMKLYALAEEKGEPFDKAIRLPLKAALCSPHFLFRIEDDPKDPKEIRTITEYELATRLSYFIWSSMPDEELFKLAEKNELRKPGVLATQVKRMLKDPKSSAMVENFAGQWLQLRSVTTATPDSATFPAWNEKLRKAFILETENYFNYIVKEDRSILEFLDSDYSFLNESLAKHYGISTVRGDEFRKVTFQDKRRGGVLTQASVLTVTSNPTRTSPVKRGKWILDNILGTPPPPPAPDVPELPPTGQLKGTLRQQMEQHRANPSCATCHSKLDPLGFGLENFDAIGSWRDKDNKQDIDSSGTLPSGATFKGPAELRKTLMGMSDQFRRCLSEKMLTFALGRGLEYYDKCSVDDILKKTKAGKDQFSALVLAVIETDAFQKRRGQRSE